MLMIACLFCAVLLGDGVILATTLVLFRLNQTKIKRLEFEQLTQFLQSQICNISIPDDTFFFNIQKGRVIRYIHTRSKKVIIYLSLGNN